MKYIGILGFLLALNWTWCLALNDNNVSLDTHTSIQEQIIGLISESIAESQDKVTRVKFETIWTELLSDKKMRASFSYVILDDKDQGQDAINGYAVLFMIDEETWTVDKVVSSNADIEFATGTVSHPSTY